MGMSEWDRRAAMLGLDSMRETQQREDEDTEEEEEPEEHETRPPRALGAAPPIIRLSLSDFIDMPSFWCVLGVDVGAAIPLCKKAFYIMARIYHPDKGGCHRTMAYLSMVCEVLTSPDQRARYMEDGDGAFKSPFGHGMGVTVTAPLINRGFLKQLMKMEGAQEVTIGRFAFFEYLEVIVENNMNEYTYVECGLARGLGAKLRLTGKAPQYPILSLPRIVRNAAFMGTGLVELDIPASHGQQICKYARVHKLPATMLEAAFGSHDNIKGFRCSTAFQEAGMKPGKVKQICNLLGYGSGCAELLKELGMIRLPSTLGKLKKEIANVRSHMVKHCPAQWKQALLQRERWELTLLSVHC
jgi:hypothetical protein